MLLSICFWAGQLARHSHAYACQCCCAAALHSQQCQVLPGRVSTGCLIVLCF